MKIVGYETGVAQLGSHFEAESDGPVGLVANFVTLTLRTDQGIAGIGYAGFVPEQLLQALRATVNALAEETINDNPHDIEAIGERLLALGGLGAPAGLVTRSVAAIDIALWDIKGKGLGQPVHKLLGGYRDRLPAYASGKLWRNYSADQLAEVGAQLVAEGFRAMKFRMGDHDSLSIELDRMRALREAVGPDIQLMVDINQGWDVNRALRAGREMDRCGLYWLEDPIHHQDYQGMAKLAAALDTPIATGEYHYGMAPFRHMFDAQCADVAMIDLLRAGGITPWMKIAHMAECHNLPVVSHLAPEIMAHCMAAIPNGLTVEHMPWSLPLFLETPPIEAGEIILSDQPGLGLEFDSAVIN